jgi:addiction module HigA family antidote
MNMMHNPPHPGEILKEEVLEPPGLGVTDAAQRLGVARTTLSRVINEHAGISPDLAIRLEAAGVGSARVWLDMQTQYEHWQALQRPWPSVEPLEGAVR